VSLICVRPVASPAESSRIRRIGLDSIRSSVFGSLLGERAPLCSLGRSARRTTRGNPCGLSHRCSESGNLRGHAKRTRDDDSPKDYLSSLVSRGIHSYPLSLSSRGFSREIALRLRSLRPIDHSFRLLAAPLCLLPSPAIVRPLLGRTREQNGVLVVTRSRFCNRNIHRTVHSRVPLAAKQRRQTLPNFVARDAPMLHAQIGPHRRRRVAATLHGGGAGEGSGCLTDEDACGR